MNRILRRISPDEKDSYFADEVKLLMNPRLQMHIIGNDEHEIKRFDNPQLSFHGVSQNAANNLTVSQCLNIRYVK